jgi:hypothetical protein
MRWTLLWLARHTVVARSNEHSVPRLTLALKTAPFGLSSMVTAAPATAGAVFLPRLSASLTTPGAEGCLLLTRQPFLWRLLAPRERRVEARVWLAECGRRSHGRPADRSLPASRLLRRSRIAPKSTFTRGTILMYLSYSAPNFSMQYWSVLCVSR